MQEERQQVILDTDIGTDVDDVVALALCLRSPAIDLLAVTTVYVNAILRARMARAVLQIAGRSEIAVGAGIGQPLLRRDPLYWAGWEGEGLLGAEDTTMAVPHAVDLLVETVLARPGQVTILAIGPLTNIALAFLREPTLATLVRRLVIMGGGIGRRPDQFHWTFGEHNIRCDPEAAHIVLSSGAPITLVPLDVTTQVRILRDNLPRLQRGDRLAALVADQVERYLDHMGRDWTHMHDPLAAAAIAHPSLLRSSSMRVLVERHGDYTRGETAAVWHATGMQEPPIDVALEVDASGFEAWLLETLA